MTSSANSGILIYDKSPYSSEWLLHSVDCWLFSSLFSSHRRYLIIAAVDISSQICKFTRDRIALVILFFPIFRFFFCYQNHLVLCGGADKMCWFPTPRLGGKGKINSRRRLKLERTFEGSEKILVINSKNANVCCALWMLSRFTESCPITRLRIYCKYIHIHRVVFYNWIQLVIHLAKPV